LTIWDKKKLGVVWSGEKTRDNVNVFVPCVLAENKDYE
jgi:hypothetical protein